MGEKSYSVTKRKGRTRARRPHREAQSGEEAEDRGNGDEGLYCGFHQQERCASGETEAAGAGLRLASLERPLEVAPGHEGCPSLSGAWPCDQSR